LREGRSTEAEELMVRELRAVTAKHGSGSPAWATAQCDLGTVLLNSDQLDRAIGCYRNAASAPVGGDPQNRKDHLTYRLNLGIALRFAGRLREAESVLRKGARDRRAFYGREHAGYAFGLEPLAALLLQRGKVRKARKVIEEVVDNFRRNGHERLGTALALRAEIVKAGSASEAPFPPLDQLPDEIVELMALVVLKRSEDADPATYRAVLTDLVMALESRLGADHQTTVNALSMLANTRRDLGDQAGRVEAIQRVLASYDRQGRAEEALTAALGLAEAQGDTGDEEAALRSYASAKFRAERIGRPELTSQVLRDWGLALKEFGQVGPAEQRLSEAVAQARRGADNETLGRAGVALGIFLQHEGRLPDARTVLAEGLSALEPVHPDALIGRSHLAAVMDGRTCGCGDLKGTIEDAFRQFVIGRLPADLLEDLTVTVEHEDFEVRVKLNRQATEDEIEHMNGVIQSAVAEFRRRIGRP
jgi:tetratricopeptide (TPR) repeat protein